LTVLIYPCHLTCDHHNTYLDYMPTTNPYLTHDHWDKIVLHYHLTLACIYNHNTHVIIFLKIEYLLSCEIKSLGTPSHHHTGVKSESIFTNSKHNHFTTRILIAYAFLYKLATLLHTVVIGIFPAALKCRKLRSVCIRINSKTLSWWFHSLLIFII